MPVDCFDNSRSETNVTFGQLHVDPYKFPLTLIELCADLIAAVDNIIHAVDSDKSSLVEELVHLSCAIINRQDAGPKAIKRFLGNVKRRLRIFDGYMELIVKKRSFILVKHSARRRSS